MPDGKPHSGLCCETASLWDAAEQIHGPWLLGHRTIGGLRSVHPRRAARGPAYTIRLTRTHTASLDNHRAFLSAYDNAPAGSMVVIQVVNNIASALGDMLVNRLRHIGVAGVVTDGYIRDLEGITAQGLPVWYRDTIMSGLSTRELYVEVNAPVAFNGTVIHPGDCVVADADGIFITPADEIAEIDRRAAEVMERSEKRHALLTAGKTMIETCRRLNPTE